MLTSVETSRLPHVQSGLGVGPCHKNLDGVAADFAVIDQLLLRPVFGKDLDEKCFKAEGALHFLVHGFSNLSGCPHQQSILHELVASASGAEFLV